MSLVRSLGTSELGPTRCADGPPAKDQRRLRQAEGRGRAQCPRHGCWAVLLRPEDRQKAAFLTWSHGLVEWVRMPMGLKDSGATYQRMLQQDEICCAASIAPEELLIVWASPPCCTFSPAIRLENTPTSRAMTTFEIISWPLTRTNPEKAAIAREHNRLMQQMWDFVEYLREVRGQASVCMENPRGSLACREYIYIC